VKTRVHLHEDTCTFTWRHVHIYMKTRAHLREDTCTFTWRRVHIYDNISLKFSFLQWEMFQTEVVEKFETHILCLVTLFRKPWLLWDNVKKITVEPVRPQTKTWRILISRWVPKSTDTHTEYIIFLLVSCYNGCRNAPECYVYKYIACLVVMIQVVLPKQRYILWL